MSQSVNSTLMGRIADIKVKLNLQEIGIYTHNDSTMNLQ